MFRQILYCFLFLLPLVGLSQEIQRITIEGKVVVPQGEDPEGITVFNQTSEKGTITNSLGEFQVEVRVNDSLRFSALQFQKFTVVIDQGVVENRELQVLIRESVTALPEVVVLPHDLTGNVEVDVARIVVEDPDLPRYSAAELEEMDLNLEPDALTGPGRNEALAASKTRLIHGLNFVNIFKVLVDATEKEEEMSKREVDRHIRRLYKDEFFRENLNISRDKINDFIYYVSDQGLPAEMLQEGNELDLIEYLVAKSEQYKALQEEP